MRGFLFELLVSAWMISAAVGDEATDARYADAIQARTAWSDCVRAQAQAQAKKTDKSVDLAADAAIAACHDQADNFMKVLEAAPLKIAPQDAAEEADKLRDNIRLEAVNFIKRLRS